MIAGQEIAVTVCALPGQIERIIREVVVAVEEDQDQAGQIYVTQAAVVQFDEFSRVAAGCVSIYFVDENEVRWWLTGGK